MTRVTTACHHMLAAVQTQGGPHPGAAARVLGLVGWTREAEAHCLPLQTPPGQLLQPLVHDIGQPPHKSAECLCLSCSCCSVKIIAYNPLD